MQHNPDDPTYLEGGDSARSTGIMALCNSVIDQYNLPMFEKPFESGMLCRHPTQYGTGDFTRDQLIPFLAGCWKAKQFELAKRVFWAHAKRLFFCQNQYEQFTGKDKGWFGRDPLGPQHIGFMILCARIYWLYPLLIFCFPVMLLDLVWATKVRPDMEQNQMIAMCFVWDLVWLYIFMHKSWQQETMKYWGKWRGQNEIGELIIKTIKQT